MSDDEDFTTVRGKDKKDTDENLHLALLKKQLKVEKDMMDLLFEIRDFTQKNMISQSCGSKLNANELLQFFHPDVEFICK